MKVIGDFVHILDSLGWVCGLMIIVIYIMGRKVDTVMRSANAALVALFVSLSLASFTAANDMKSAMWSEYYGVVQSSVVPAEFPDGRAVTFATFGIPAEIESLSATSSKPVYLCGELTCHHIESGDRIFMQRKWAGPEDGWLMRDVKVIKK